MRFSITTNIILVLVLVVLLQYWWHDTKALNTEIREAREQRDDMEAKNEALLSTVEGLKEEQQALQGQVAEKDQRISEIQVALDARDAEFKAVQSSLYRLRNDDASFAAFKKEFPVFARGAKMVWQEQITVDPESGQEFRTDMFYAVMPTRFLDTFTRDRTELVKLREDRADLTQIVDLQNEIRGLNNQILALESEKLYEYQKGYGEAYTLFMETNEKYLDSLRSDRNRNVLSSIGAVVTGIALGVNF